MNSSTLKTIITIVLFIHAIGHVQGVLVALGMFSTETWNAKSWLLDGVIGEKASRFVALILWLAVTIGFLAVAFAFLGIGLPYGIWRQLAVPLAVIATVGLILYWNSFASLLPNKIGALAVNIGIIVGLVFLKWPSEADLGF